MTRLSLDDLGWQRHESTSTSSSPADPDVRPARVVDQGSGAWHVHDGDRTRLARLPSRSIESPVTGDWVLVRSDGGEGCWIDAVLPRRTTLARVVAGPRSAPQVLAANVDVVGVCTPADDPNPRRVERELTAVWESGASPLCLVTKVDLVPDPESAVASLAAVAVGTDVLGVTVATSDGLAGLRARLDPGSTLALIGPSGVGKSSIVNALVGDEVMTTTEVRADGKGRHTTTTRRLVALPSGGLVLDTPGMREFAPWASESALSEAFADIEELAAECRFTDCTHAVEPGCAVLAAAEADEQVSARLASWRALQKELAWLARRNDARLMSEERRRWAIITRSARDRIRP